ncbi:MAG: hypothetical protein ACO4CT_18925, partial [Planctomycetota bacterium]
MIRALAFALASTSALVPQGPTPRYPSNPRAELNLPLRGTRPDLQPIREAIRDRNPASAADA